MLREHCVATPQGRLGPASRSKDKMWPRGGYGQSARSQAQYTHYVCSHSIVHTLCVFSQHSALTVVCSHSTVHTLCVFSQHSVHSIVCSHSTVHTLCVFSQHSVHSIVCSHSTAHTLLAPPDPSHLLFCFLRSSPLCFPGF